MKKSPFIFSKDYLNIKDLILILSIHIVMMIVVAQFIVSPVMEQIDSLQTYQNNDGARISLSYIISSTITLIIVLIYRAFRVGEQQKGLWKIFHRGKASPLRFLWGAALVLSAQIIVNPILDLFQESTESYYQMFKVINDSGFWGVLAAVIVAPIFEEILYRGIIMRDIYHSYGKFRAIIISSLSFALIHLNFAQMIPAFITAIVFGYVYLMTKSIWMVISLHGLNNAFSYLLFNLMSEEEYNRSFREMFTSQSLYWVVYGVAALFLVIMFIRLTVLTVWSNKKGEEVVIGIDEKKINIEEAR